METVHTAHLIILHSVNTRTINAAQNCLNR